MRFHSVPIVEEFVEIVPVEVVSVEMVSVEMVSVEVVTPINIPIESVLVVLVLSKFYGMCVRLISALRRTRSWMTQWADIGHVDRVVSELTGSIYLGTASQVTRLMARYRPGSVYTVPATPGS
jgi:hypothetical protein